MLVPLGICRARGVAVVLASVAAISLTAVSAVVPSALAEPITDTLVPTTTAAAPTTVPEATATYEAPLSSNRRPATGGAGRHRGASDRDHHASTDRHDAGAGRHRAALDRDHDGGHADTDAVGHRHDNGGDADTDPIGTGKHYRGDVDHRDLVRDDNDQFVGDDVLQHLDDSELACGTGAVEQHVGHRNNPDDEPRRYLDIADGRDEWSGAHEFERFGFRRRDVRRVECRRGCGAHQSG